MLSDAEESARKLFAQQCDFVLAAADPKQFPSGTLPEVAFIGRSNVGKSSLINALTGRKALARASNTPGRTQQIVFFNLGRRLMLVDLPGYGHAEAPIKEKDKWMDLVQSYLTQRPQLQCICLLLDGRHGAKSNDIEMMGYLDRAGVIYQLVMTKSDQVKADVSAAHCRDIAAITARHPAARSEIMLTSAEKKHGIGELRMLLADWAVKANH